MWLSKIQEFLSKKFCQVLKPSAAHKRNENYGPIVAKLKEIFTLILSSTRIAFMTKINFNSIVIGSQFSNVSVFFLLKNVLVPHTIHVKGLHVQTKFVPVRNNQTEVLLVHPVLVFFHEL